MKPREFWLNASYWHSIDDKPFNRNDTVYLREVVPIDWKKVWNDYCDGLDGDSDNLQLIQQLVEKQLAGEE